MELQITAQAKQAMLPQGQQILAGIDDYLAQVAARGRQMTQLVLKDTDFNYLVNQLQVLNKRFDVCGRIDYQGIKLVRKVY